MKKERLYKVLAADGSSCHGGKGKWPLPSGRKKGEWLEVNLPLSPCRHGLHLCRRADLIHWIGETIYIAEAAGERQDEDNKVVVQKARLIRPLRKWNDKTARLFAAGCALYALRQERKAGREPHVYSWAAVKAAYDFARGKINQETLSAAESAAWSAGESAARSAAWSAAETAARSAAWYAAEKWQTRLLMHYLGEP